NRGGFKCFWARFDSSRRGLFVFGPAAPELKGDSMSGKASFVSQSKNYRTAGGIGVQRILEPISYKGAIDPTIHALDDRRGLVLASGVEYPGRYSRWDIGFVDPPLALECQGREFRIIALNSRGRLLLDVVTEVLLREPAVQTFEARGCETIGTIVSS